MFGMFAKKNDTGDIVAQAAAQATRETDEAIAASRFLETIGKSEQVMNDLRDTYCKTVDEMCASAGIRNEFQRRSLRILMDDAWEPMLHRAVREYLQDCRAQTGEEALAQRGLVIEFVTA